MNRRNLFRAAGAALLGAIALPFVPKAKAADPCNWEMVNGSGCSRAGADWAKGPDQAVTTITTANPVEGTYRYQYKMLRWPDGAQTLRAPGMYVFRNGEWRPVSP